MAVGVLDGCSVAPRRAPPGALAQPTLALPPLRASVDRITNITVCCRPFRAQGPRLELEKVGEKTVIHNYGHGGSGWSLPWGSKSIAALMMFNISAYSRMLMSDFIMNGGRIEVREFHSPADFGSLPQKTLIHATGYGARALFGDTSVIPVRGQLARMIPQPDVSYGLFYKRVSFIPRRDGWVFQMVGEDDYYGFDDDTTVPDRAEAELAVNTIAALFRA